MLLRKSNFNTKSKFAPALLPLICIYPSLLSGAIGGSPLCKCRRRCCNFYRQCLKESKYYFWRGVVAEIIIEKVPIDEFQLDSESWRSYSKINLWYGIVNDSCHYIKHAVIWIWEQNCRGQSSRDLMQFMLNKHADALWKDNFCLQDVVVVAAFSAIWWERITNKWNLPLLSF